MEQFNLEEYKKNPNRKIITRDGRPVRIICWDAKVDIRQKDYHIIALIDNGTHGEDISYFNEQGVEFFKREEFFFAEEEKTNKILDELKSYLEKTPKEQVEKDWKEIQDWYAQHFTNEKHNDEEELTEFEKELNRIVIAFSDAHAYMNKNEIHYYSKGLLDLARKEIFQDLPKWKKSDRYIECGVDDFFFTLEDDGKISPYYSTEIEEGQYYISNQDLLNLPKEE